jgi:hypothetical protein
MAGLDILADQYAYANDPEFGYMAARESRTAG